jgi:hypothetical protein
MEAAEGRRPFEPNAILERLAASRRTRRREFDALDSSVRSAVDWYEAAKRRVEQLKQ